VNKHNHLPTPTAVACRVFAGVCLSVCFPHDISKTDAKIKLEKEMFHDESWKLIYLGVKRSSVKITKHKTLVGLQTTQYCHANNSEFFLRHAR